MSYAIFQEDKSIASSACVEKGNRKTSTITINVGVDMCSKAPIQLSTGMRGGTAAGSAGRRGKETKSSRSSGSRGGGSGSSGSRSGGSNSNSRSGGGANSSRGETKTKTGGGRFLKSKRTSNFVGKSSKAKAAPPAAPSRNKKGPPPKVAKRKERVKAMYDYTAADSDELSMKGKVLCVACVLPVCCLCAACWTTRLGALH